MIESDGSWGSREQAMRASRRCDQNEKAESDENKNLNSKETSESIQVLMICEGSFGDLRVPDMISDLKISRCSSLCAGISVALCSRQLYLRTIPHLYRHIVIHEGVQKDDKKPQKLALAPIRRPDLASLVRRFTFRQTRSSKPRVESSEGSEDSDSSETSAEPGEPEEDVVVKTVEIEGLQDYKTAVNASSLTTEEQSKWLEGLSHTWSCQESILALLLPILHGVEKLDLRLQAEFSPRYLKRMVGRAARREKPFDVQPPFNAPTTFSLSHKMSNVQSPSFFALLLKLSAIDVISGGFGNHFDHEESDLTDIKSFSSPLTSLYLTAHESSKKNLGHILRAPKALKTFFYTFYSPCGIDFTAIRHALGPQESCLEILSLDHDVDFTYYRYGIEDREFLKPMTSFLSFSSLKIFVISAPFLQSTDNGTEHHRLINIFPASLETLHLTRIEARSESLLRAVEDVLAHKSQEQIPSLTKVVLHQNSIRLEMMDTIWKVTHETAMGRLSRAAVAHGVTIDESMLTCG